jgi:TIR domain-containing protein
MSSIFLSHNHRDKSFVRRLGHDLSSNGIRVWVDEAEILVGDSLIQKVESAIDEMEYLGVVLSPNSIESEWVRREVRAALTHEIIAHRVKVLPILIADCTFPLFLNDKAYADFRRAEDYQEAFEDLLRALHRKSLPSLSRSPIGRPNHRASSPRKELEVLKPAYEEEKLTAILSVTFGPFFWQVNHALHWFFGLAYAQVSTGPGLPMRLGETAFDPYMGFAQLIGLSAGVAPLAYLLRGRTSYLITVVTAWPLLINLILGEIRERHSISGVAFSAMQSMVLALLLIVGYLRKEYSSIVSASKSDVSQPINLDVLSERASGISLATLIGSVLVLVCGGVITASMFLVPSQVLVWPINAKERQVLALVFLMTTILLFCEVAFFVWPRAQTLKAALAPSRTRKRR